MRKVLLTASLLFCVLLVGSAFSQGDEKGSNTGTVTGVIQIKGGGPMAGGTVFFFDAKSGPPPSATKYWRVPTQAFLIDDNGQFSVLLPEGDYYLGAIKRLSGERLGPPQDADYFFISKDEKGLPRKINVRKEGKIDLGVFAEAVPYNPDTAERRGITSIQGRIRDEKGNPMEGMMVFAFTNPSMFGRPLYVSERSDKNGNYLLRLASGGKFYLMARMNYGGGPRSADELIGIYKDGAHVTLETGEVKKGINITVVKYLEGYEKEFNRRSYRQSK